MKIKTIEERLKIKADAIGSKKAERLAFKPHELRKAFNLCKKDFEDGSIRKKIINIDGWDVASVCEIAMAKLYKQRALEDLRREIMEMHENLSGMISVDKY